MKLKILKQKLKEGLSIVERIIIKSTTLPILGNVLFKAQKNFLEIAATDLEIAIKWWGLAKIEKEGKITIPGKVFSNFIGFLEEKPVELKKEDNFLIVETEKYKTKFKVFDAEEYPIIPEITEGEIITIDADIFCSSLEHVSQIPILSTARPEISGIYLVFKKDLITLVGTDSFRLGEKKIFLKKLLNLKQEYSMILPQKTAREVINVFGQDKGSLKIYFSANQIAFESQMEEIEHPKVQVISKLIEGEYPNYQAIFPQKSKTEILINKDEFLNHLRAASIFASKMNEVTLKIDGKNKRIEIFSQNPDTGEYHSFLPCRVSGKDTKVSFNWRFLIDGLANLKKKEAIFELNDEEGPAVLKQKDDPTFVYLVMPVKSS